jgi:hypothetical protein
MRRAKYSYPLWYLLLLNDLNDPGLKDPGLKEALGL